MPPSSGAAKVRWKFSFARTSASSSSSPSSSPSPSTNKQKHLEPIPVSFLCPISTSLMADPVIVPTGITFERACIEACRELSFTPPLLSSSVDLSSPSFLLIPNAALRSAIIDWCDRLSLPHPSPVSLDQARHFLQHSFIPNHQNHQSPPRELRRQAEQLASSRSCPSTSSSSSSSSSEITNDENDGANKTAPFPPRDPLEEQIFLNLKSPHLSLRESALATLRRSTRESAEHRASFCTPTLLAALIPMISSPKHAADTTAAIVNLSIHAPNKLKIVRAGAVPLLVGALSSHGEARSNAAAALFSLALEDDNKLAIGVLGAIPSLLSLFCCEQQQHLARVEAGMALYHLSLAPNNASKIAKMAGAVKALLNVATTDSCSSDDDDDEKRRKKVAMMVLASAARREEGRLSLMDAGAVRLMVRLMSGLANEGDELCWLGLEVLYEMSNGMSFRFRALARVAGAEEVLLAMMEGSGEVAKEMARRTLKVVRGESQERGLVMLDDEEEEEDEVASVVSDGLVSFRRRYGYEFDDSSASNSANF